MTNSSVNFDKASTSAYFSNHSLYTRLLLLLVFGSRPGDHTEGTLVGIGDATNMAVIPQGLTNVKEVSALNIDAEHLDRTDDCCTKSTLKTSASVTTHTWGGRTNKKTPRSVIF